LAVKAGFTTRYLAAVRVSGIERKKEMNIMQKGGLLGVIAGFLALSACDSGDQRLCTEANWYQTGVFHAQQGYENRLPKLQSICSEIGITPDAAEYTRGYISGPNLPRLNL
jgi:hypothetical protein